MKRRSICRTVFGVLIVLAAYLPALAQHHSREFAVSFASKGQLPFAEDGNSGFFTAPFILDLRYQIATNFVQSASVVFEHIAESRSHTGLWSPNGSPVVMGNEYNANISEFLQLNTLSIEVITTVVRFDDFRVGIGGSFGYSLGTATADVENIATHTNKTVDATQLWSSFYLSLFSRGQLSVYDDDNIDVALTATARYWGLPTLGPLTKQYKSGGYIGPNLGSVHELGYLVGVSVGLK